MKFMAGVTDHMIGVPFPQEINLVQLGFRIFMRICSHTVVQRQRYIAMLKKHDQIIKIFLRHPAGRNNDRPACFGNFFQQHPVVIVCAGHLDDRHVELDTPVN